MPHSLPLSDQLARCRIVSGSMLKVIAVLSMLVDHVALFLLKDIPECGTVLFAIGSLVFTPYVLCRLFGRLAFPIFAFLVVEGFLHTRNRMRYGLNLLIFALLSEMPWNLVNGGTLLYPTQNVLFTLLLGYLGLCAIEAYKKRWLPQAAIIVGLFAVSMYLHANFGAKGYILILSIYCLRHIKPVQAVVGMLILPFKLMVGLSFVVINMYNGKRGFIQGNFAKYLFYIIFPLHLLIIWLIQDL